jgi:hypothetical protein
LAENSFVTAEDIEKYLQELNDELCAVNIKGEICLYGGAVMCLAFKTRPATKDVDAIFEPVKEIRRAAGKIAEKYDLPIGWLNFAVKMFVTNHQKQILFDLPYLKVYTPEADYLLAMKILAARADTSDLEDIEFLLGYLNLKAVEDVLKIVGDFYPKKEVKPETVFLLEELLERSS